MSIYLFFNYFIKLLIIIQDKEVYINKLYIKKKQNKEENIIIINKNNLEIIENGIYYNFIEIISKYIKSNLYLNSHLYNNLLNDDSVIKELLFSDIINSENQNVTKCKINNHTVTKYNTNESNICILCYKNMDSNICILCYNNIINTFYSHNRIHSISCNISNIRLINKILCPICKSKSFII